MLFQVCGQIGIWFMWCFVQAPDSKGRTETFLVKYKWEKKDHIQAHYNRTNNRLITQHNNGKSAVHNTLINTDWAFSKEHYESVRRNL